MKIFKPYSRIMGAKIAKDILNAYNRAPEAAKLDEAIRVAESAVHEILHDARLEMVNALIALPTEEMEENPE